MGLADRDLRLLRLVLLLPMLLWGLFPVVYEIEFEIRKDTSEIEMDVWVGDGE